MDSRRVALVVFDKEKIYPEPSDRKIPKFYDIYLLVNALLRTITAALAQLAERRSRKPKVVGSIPAGGRFFF
jgi:hypothetical protein